MHDLIYDYDQDGNSYEESFDPEWIAAHENEEPEWIGLAPEIGAHP